MCTFVIALVILASPGGSDDISTVQNPDSSSSGAQVVDPGSDSAPVPSATNGEAAGGDAAGVAGPPLPVASGADGDPATTSDDEESSGAGSSTVDGSPEGGTDEAGEAQQTPSDGQSGPATTRPPTNVPPPISVPLPLPTAPTTSAPAEVVSCSVIVEGIDTPIPTASIDRHVVVGTEVDAPSPIPTVWVELRWDQQIRRAAIELSPSGIGQIIIPAPGIGPVTAQVFTSADFAPATRRCLS